MDRISDAVRPRVGGGDEMDLLVVVSGKNKGSVFPIPPDGLTLGRGTRSDNPLSGDDKLSRSHAAITRDYRGGMFVEDLASTNGTLLNGVRIDGPQRLHAGDTIKLGESELQVIEGSAYRAGGESEKPAVGTVAPIGEDWSGFEIGTGALSTPAVIHDPSQSASEAGSEQNRAGSPLKSRSANFGSQWRQDVVVGQVRAFQHRTDDLTCWTFRVEQYDSSGNRLRPIPVEMRGFDFEGSLNDGDEVRVVGTWKNGTLRSEKVENRTTNATVTLKSLRKAFVTFAVIVTILVSGLVTFVVIVNSSFDGQSDQRERQFCDQVQQQGVIPPGC